MKGDIAMKENINTSEKKLIGEILLEAGLITPSQLEVALADQSQFFKLKIGEILALRGWLKSQTADFLVEIENKKSAKVYKKEYPIGYYFKKAGLLSHEQIDNILVEQKKLGIKFCETAILKGYLKQQTAEFFLDFLSKDGQDYHNNDDDDIDCDDTILRTEEKDITNGKNIKVTRIMKDTNGDDFHSAETHIAPITEEEDIIITPQEIIIISNTEAKCFYYGGVAYSPISIDN
ncbi:hypothetical protein [Cyanobacterium sp. HL-69]|uniref:hypothetical protein n=1 Tax=Cyanobacterium sp. HL-69 TaxID=2054282 RepID=UPI00406BD98D